jgi:hypothetical protein
MWTEAVDRAFFKSVEHISGPIFVEAMSFVPAKPVWGAVMMRIARSFAALIPPKAETQKKEKP